MNINNASRIGTLQSRINTVLNPESNLGLVEFDPAQLWDSTKTSIAPHLTIPRDLHNGAKDNSTMSTPEIEIISASVVRPSTSLRLERQEIGGDVFLRAYWTWEGFPNSGVVIPGVVAEFKTTEVYSDSMMDSSEPLSDEYLGRLKSLSESVDTYLQNSPE